MRGSGAPSSQTPDDQQGQFKDKRTQKLSSLEQTSAERNNAAMEQPTHIAASSSHRDRRGHTSSIAREQSMNIAVNTGTNYVLLSQPQTQDAGEATIKALQRKLASARRRLRSLDQEKKTYSGGENRD